MSKSLAEERLENDRLKAELELTEFVGDVVRRYPLLGPAQFAVILLELSTIFVKGLALVPHLPVGQDSWPDAPTGDWEGGETPDGFPVMWLNVESTKLSALTYINDREYDEDGPPVLVARFKGSAEFYRYLDVGPDIWHKLLRAAAGKLEGWTVGEFFSEYVEKAHYCELWDGLRWGEPKRGQRPGVSRP